MDGSVNVIRLRDPVSGATDEILVEVGLVVDEELIGEEVDDEGLPVEEVVVDDVPDVEA